MTTEMLVKVETWPAKLEVMAVSVMVLVPPQEEAEYPVDDVLVEEVPNEEEVDAESEVELVSSIND